MLTLSANKRPVKGFSPNQAKNFNALFRNRPWFQSSCTRSVKELGVLACVAFAENQKGFSQIVIIKQESGNCIVAWTYTK